MMKEYENIVEALSRRIHIPGNAMMAYADDIAQTAEDIHRRRPYGSFDDQLAKCLIGSVCEHAAKELLNTRDVWSRFSKQETYEDRMFDLAVIQRDKYEGWLPYETKIDVKSSNKDCAGQYFAFNCYDTSLQEEYELQDGRPGANLHFFIRKSHNTDLLLTMDRFEVADGWLVTPKYLIHRKAFNKVFRVSQYDRSPYYYLRYEDMIRDGTCVKIPQQPS